MPALSVRVSPEIAIVPALVALVAAEPAASATPPGDAQAATAPARGAPPPAVVAEPRRAKPAPPAAAAACRLPTREIRVTVVNDTQGAAESVVTLDAPAGLDGDAGRADGDVHARGRIADGAVPGAGRAAGREAGEYPHRGDRGRRRAGVHARISGDRVPAHPPAAHLRRGADATLKVIDVKTAPNLTVGYVMGVGDEVPPAIEQLGVKVEMLGAEDLAWGDLSRFHTIVTGVRAYERRADLRANNSRLLDYVSNGGTLIVQYNKFEFNEAQYGPYPAEVSANRVTDENAPVKILDRGHPVFTTPNEMTDSVWNGWVQERGLYFLGEKDSRYRDLVALDDPFPNNPGEKSGALVEAPYGKGRWVYVGLGLWRELPAGVAGAYQLLANLISLK